MAFPYNISEVSGQSSGGLGDVSYTLDITDPSVTTVTGDFNQVAITLTGTVDEGEAAGGYVFDNFSSQAYFSSISLDTTDGTFSFGIDKQALYQSGMSQVTVTFDVTGFESTAPDSEFDTDTVTINFLICMATGTMIDTDRGDRPVEDLRPGDLVWTRDDGLRPILWAGRRAIGAAELAANPDLRPIRISADAFGPGTPERDLVVSPQHRLLLSDWRAQLFYGEDEVLVPAKALVNDCSIRVDRAMPSVTYHHLLFDRHQVIRTDGALTESFYPGAYTLSALDAAARDELLGLFPDLARSAAYGPPARPPLRPAEARLLA